MANDISITATAIPAAANCVEIVTDSAFAYLRYPEAETLPCTCGTDPMDLLVTMDFDKRGRPVMRDSELVKAARAGNPVILNNVDWLPLFTRLVLHKIVNAANAGRDSITINGRYILFKSGFKAVAVTKKAYV